MALKEKVPVTSGKKKASVRKETNAVSGMRATIMRKNQNTKPPHLLSHQCHEVEVCVHSSTNVQIPFERHLHEIAF